MQSLTTKQQKAIIALLDQPTLKDAAAACGVNESTLWRWQQEPVFQREYRAARSRSLEAMVNGLLSLGGLIAQTLKDVMEDEAASPSARASAARAAGELILKARADFEIEARLRELETLVAQRPTTSLRRV